MIYKPFGNTGIEMSALGFGAMRLPMEGKQVNTDLATEMIRKAVELGVNYVDTAPYYCEHDSERAVGIALKPIRDKVYLSTKSPVADKNPAAFRQKLEASLKKLDTDHVDFYHFWGINLATFEGAIDVPGGLYEAALKAKEEGLIRHISFSFHDKAENMRPIVDSGLFESVLCQYNLLDRANEAEIAHATKRGLGVVIMGPVGGGRLGAPSEVIRGLLGHKVQSSAEMALRFVLANPNVNIALSGMSDMSQLIENNKVASIGGELTAEEISQVNEMMEENKRLAELYCTGCRYCMPCPQGINIPKVFEVMNLHRVYKLTKFATEEYARLAVPINERTDWEQANGVQADACVECGHCEAECPQKLQIISQLKESHKTLTS
ncbi:MAG: aldo/keto reductase [Oscillospiraceae bacterium]|jgi:predicted aldo/keto reductase-like oxidoreductase|nr:aldo/keto reductase [Oscillospiraceae bacterium]